MNDEPTSLESAALEIAKVRAKATTQRVIGVFLLLSIVGATFAFFIIRDNKRQNDLLDAVRRTNTATCVELILRHRGRQEYIHNTIIKNEKALSDYLVAALAEFGVTVPPPEIVAPRPLEVKQPKECKEEPSDDIGEADGQGS